MSSSKSNNSSSGGGKNNMYYSPSSRKRSPSPALITQESVSKKASYDRKLPSTEEVGEVSVSIKGRYERKAAGEGSSALLDKALGGLRTNPTVPIPSTPNSSSSSNSKINVTTASADSRAQFEQQEDFISFDFGDESSSKQRMDTPQRSGGGGSKRKKGNEWEAGGMDEGSRKVRKRERDRSTPWCDEPGVDWSKCDSPTAMLNAEAHAFITYISPTPIEHQLRMWTVELIRRTIRSRWSDADVQCFGSVGTGLYLPGGDIDLVVLCPSFPSPPLKPTSSLLHSLASLLLTSSLAVPSSLIVIAKARVPIVKFVTRYGGFSIDLSVNQQGGVDAAVRVRAMLEEHAFRGDKWVEPGSTSGRNGKGKGKAEEIEEGETEMVDHGVARSLVLLVKAYLNQRGMNEVFTGGLGSYSIICLVVSFLQLHPQIQSGQIHPGKNIGLLFHEFNEYYGKHFNYDVTGITLRGRGGYFNKHDKGWWRAQQPYLLSIEDPNDPLNDVSGGSHNIIRVRQTIGGASDCLAATLFQRASEFAHLRNPLLPVLSASALPNADLEAPNPLCQSVLGTIIGMSRDGMQSREENIRLFNEGILQDLLEISEVGGKGLGGKKAMKKLRKEEKDEKRMEKTVKRLEMRKEEREAKESKREAKKLREAGGGIIVPASTSAKGVRDEVARKLFSSNSSSKELQDEGEEESRYSIVNSPNSKRTSNSTPSTSKLAEEVFYVGSDNSSDEDEDDMDISDEDEDDVILGGTGGDRLRGPKKNVASSEGSSEDDEVISRQLVGGKSAEASSSIVVTKVSAATKQERKDRSEAKTKFWTDKSGKKIAETIVLDSD